MIDIVKADENTMEEMQDYEMFESENGYKINRYEITTYVTQRSIESLIKWVEKGKIIIPDFQREYVWPKAVASKLIDSVLLNLPIPNIFLYKMNRDGEEIYYVVDGFQRIQTLKYFREGLWNPNSNIKNDDNIFRDELTSIFKISYKASEWVDKSYQSLSKDDQFCYDEYSVNLTVFEQSNPDNKNSMFEVFERINTGSDKLSEQEIRNAIFPGKFLKMVREYANQDKFKIIVDKDSSMKKRQNFVDLFLRFVTYSYLYENNFILHNKKITTSKKDTLNNFCEMFNNQDSKLYIKFIENVANAIKVIYDFNENAFYGKMRNENKISEKIHSVFSEALVIAVIQNSFKINISKEKFDDYKLSLWGTTDFEEKFVQQTTTIKNIEGRAKMLLEVINNDIRS